MAWTGLIWLRTGATGLVLEARSVIFGFHSMRAVRDWLRTNVAQNSALLISYIRVPSMCFLFYGSQVRRSAFSDLIISSLSEFVLQLNRECYLIPLSCTNFPFSTVNRSFITWHFQAPLQNYEKRPLTSSCLLVRSSVWNNSAPTGRIKCNLIFEYFSKICRENSSSFNM